MIHRSPGCDDPGLSIREAAASRRGRFPGARGPTEWILNEKRGGGGGESYKERTLRERHSLHSSIILHEVEHVAS